MTFPSETVKFGKFELNIQTGELTLLEIQPDPQTQKVLLREQPFQILKMLLARQGKIVSREEIKNQLWPNGTPADSDRSINVAMVALRRVLSDSAETPQYIETIARRGYRLLVSAEWQLPPAIETPPVSETKEQDELGVSPETASVQDEPVSGMIGGKLSRIGLVALTVAILGILCATGLWLHSQNRVRLGKDDTIVRADLDNQTGDVAFSDGLNLALQIALGQTPSLTTLSDVKVRETRLLLNLPVNSKFTEDAAIKVCVATHSRAALSGSVTDQGNHFHILLQVRDCQTGRLMTQTSQNANGRGDVVRALGNAVYEIRAKLGEPRDSLMKFNKPLEQATSASPEALHYLALGYKTQLSGNASDAMPYYELAIENDPECALAYAGEGSVDFWRGHADRGIGYLQKAFALRDRLTAPQRFNIVDLYYGTVLGQWDNAFPILKDWVATFPRDVIARINLAGTLAFLGRPDEQLVQAREAVRLLPSAPTYYDWVTAAICAGHMEEARLAYKEAIGQTPDSPDLHVQSALLGLLQNNEAQMQHEWDWALEHPDLSEPVIYFHSKVEAYKGRFRSSHAVMLQLLEQVQKSGPAKDLAYYPAAEALREVEVGKLTRATLKLPAVTLNSQDWFTRTYAALVLARAGRGEEATRFVDDLNRDFPSEFEVQHYCLPVIRAAIQLSKDSPQAAVDLLKPMVQYDLATTRGFDYLYPAYLRGLAYLQLKRPDLAVSEFQKLLDHPGIVGGFVTGAAVYVQLARAQAMMGNKEAALKSYEKFLELWAGADKEIPLYRDAKYESARLHQASSR